jgi:hypothetical protein
MEYINERVDNTVSLMLKIDNLPSIAIDYRKSIYEQLRNDPDFLELDDTVKLLIKATLLSENASLNIITIGKAISERIRKGALED